MVISAPSEIEFKLPRTLVALDAAKNARQSLADL
jgi:hypothetical protein